MKTYLRILAPVSGLCGIVLLMVWWITQPAPAKLEWDPPHVRKSIMSFAHKVYENPEVADGRYFLSKIVFRNTGDRPVHDLAISYQVPGYIPWTTPETTRVLPGGNSLVKVYYPAFPSSITQLNNRTTSVLETRIQWRDSEKGPLREEIHRENFTILGVNELQYSDLPSQEITTWYDFWTMAQFMICMVTPNDPVVKEYAALITERTGGSMAGVTRKPEDVIELMKAIYEYMIETGMRYAGAKGVPETFGDVTSLIQTVRLPRDVILSNNGLCIELALLWASLLDHLGCRSYIVLRPGHAFVIVQAEGQSFPIECTAITPKAVEEENTVPFARAVQLAMEDLQRQQLKMFYGVQEYQNMGYASPELPPVDTARIKEILLARKPVPPRRDERRPEVGPTPEQPVLALYRSPQGLLAFQYPRHWQPQPYITEIGCIFAAGDPQSGASVVAYEIPGAANPAQAMQMLSQQLAQYGQQVQVQGTESRGGVTFFQGVTHGGGGTYQWVGAFRSVPGGVTGITAGAPSWTFASSQPHLQQVLSTLQFAP